MNRLTHLRVNGIKNGYWSAAKKEDLVQRLAEYENTGLEPEEIIDGQLLTGWILCDEMLPGKRGRYLISMSFYDGSNRVLISDYDPCNIDDVEWMSVEPDAWMPLPKPYKAGDSQ